MILEPKSLYGYGFLESHGKEWVLIRKQDPFYTNTRPGPWGLVQQVDGLKTFFLHLTDDPHFLIQSK